jgi:hypothetical protein
MLQLSGGGGYELYWSFCFIKFKIVLVMEAILPSSDTAPLSSVIIYCTVVATLNMSRDEVVTLGDWTD